VLAFLTSLAKIAFMVPIVEGLGQLKWNWFLSSQPRPLSDFEVFDQATRGGLSSLKLILKFKGWVLFWSGNLLIWAAADDGRAASFLACFGAVIALSGLLTSTLTQQAISYQVARATSYGISDKATVDRATSFSAYDGNDISLGKDLMDSAIGTLALPHLTKYCRTLRHNQRAKSPV
jgi:Protein of unknown function (DUF3176)